MSARPGAGQNEITIITTPLSDVSELFLKKFVRIFDELGLKTTLISGIEDKEYFQTYVEHYFEIFDNANVNKKGPIGFLKTQMLTCKYILNLKSNKYLFFLSQTQLIPLLLIKILKYRSSIYIVPGGNSSAIYAIQRKKSHLLLTVFEKLTYLLVDRIVLYSPNLVSEWNLDKYLYKIQIAHRHYLDFHRFVVTTPFVNRPPLIGYVGRLSEEKGVLYLAQALPSILSNQRNLRVLIGGDGHLLEVINASLCEQKIAHRVDLPGWISHDDLPKSLNKLRLLILPSCTEGLPNIMLEAMACGTPVLATPVGGIPDVIEDGKTGFIMEDTSPECIAKNVIRALNSPELDQIAENGRLFVEENFTFEKVLEKWERILHDF